MPAESAASPTVRHPGPLTGEAESDFQRLVLAELTIAWTERAAALPGNEIPLVLLHGFTGHRDDWLGVLPILAQDRRVVAPDLRGHGDSDSPPEASAYSFESWLKDLFDLLDHLGIERCDLLGHSAGGMLAMRAAHREPGRIRHLILMSTGPAMPTSLPRAGFERAASIAEAKGMARLQQLMERAGRAEADPMVALWGERYWTHQRRRFNAMTPASYRGFGGELYRAASFAPKLGEIESPTWILVGLEDAPFLPGTAELEAGLRPGRARSVRIPRAGHHPHQENPEAWFRAMQEIAPLEPQPSGSATIASGPGAQRPKGST